VCVCVCVRACVCACVRACVCVCTRAKGSEREEETHRHVVVVVRPVDRDRNILRRVDTWLANWSHHDLVLLVAHDGHHLVIEALDDVGWEWRVALVGPEDLSVVRRHLRRPHV
jgi:hypothetical protein